MTGGGRLRDHAASDARMRRSAMLTAIAAIAPLSVLGVALTAESWWEGIVVAVGYLLTLGVLREWSLDGYPRRSVFACMFTAACWCVGALTASSPISFVPFALVGALLLARTRHRAAWTVGFALGVAALGALSFAFHPVTWTLAAGYLLTPAVGTLSIAGVIIASEQAWLIVRRLHAAEETEAQLAIARERARFAGDLHDIHGHSLHAIKLKATLAGRVLRDDPDRAMAEVDEIRRLADETIAQTRALAYARHELSLAAEVENAKRLCEAAGIAVEAEVEAGAAESAHPLLAQVLREATTNLLRHAQPTTVTIAASRGVVRIANDGVAGASDSPLHGLAHLGDRVRDAGGELRVERRAREFVVEARIDLDLPAADQEPKR